MCAIIGFDSPTLTEQEIRPYFDRTVSRGPDMSRMEKAGRGMLGFHRLAIMGLHEEGMQPFHLGGDMAVCNGELYGFRPLKKELEAKGYTFASESDCELILPLYREYGVEMFAKLDAEFAMIIYDAKADRLVAARDPIGIRLSRRRRHHLRQRGEEPRRSVRAHHALPAGPLLRRRQIRPLRRPHHGDGILQGRSGHCMQKDP